MSVTGRQPQPTAAAAAQQQLSTAQLIAALVGWFASSCLFNYLTPQLIKLVSVNQDVTMLELLVTSAFGLLSVRLRCLPLLPPGGSVLRWLVVGCLHLANCRCFIHGLQFMPVSLAQTIRAASPMVAVPIAMLLGETYSTYAVLSLVPVIWGFALSVGADSSDAPLSSCISMVGSVCCFVLVNARCKVATGNPAQVQFWVIFFAMIVLVPFWIWGGGIGRVWAVYSNWLLAVVLADGFMYYLEQISQQYVIRALPFLSFAITDTVRRLTIVCVSGFLIQGNPCTFLNMVGIILVLVGAVAHNVAVHHDSADRDLEAAKKPQ